MPETPDPGAMATPARILNRAAASLERLNAFSDGVFSIAITLLLFEVRAPAVEALDASGKSLADALWDERVPFLTLALSFALMGIYWVGHAAMFRLIQRADRNLLWANLLFLLFVGLIPFSAVMLTSYVDRPGDDRVAITVYSANLILAGLSLDLLWHHASKGKRLIDPAIHDHVVWMVHVRVLAGAAVYLVAIALAWLVSVRATLVFLVLTPIFYIFPFVFDRIEEWHVRQHPHD